MPSALVLQQPPPEPNPAVQPLDLHDLPSGDVLVRVQYSSLNYKDGLAVTGQGPVVRSQAYPFVPGIDLVGTVEVSESEAWRPGDAVIGTGWGLGEDRWGGYATHARVGADTLVRLPERLSPRRAMTLGTAGLTAMLSVMALERGGLRRASGPVVVTGASGGVGSVAVAVLHRLGYEVAASTGSEAAHDDLRALGAHRIIGRDVLGGGPKRPLESARWAGAVDAVGGPTLAALLAQTQRHGAVAACGLAQSATLETTVMPFILRGVALLGIDSNTCPNSRRTTAWGRLASLLSSDVLDRLTAAEIGLEDVPAWSRRILAGDVRGRVVVRVGS